MFQVLSCCQRHALWALYLGLGLKLTCSKTALIARCNSGLHMCFLYRGMCKLIFFSQSIDKEQYLVLSIPHYHFETHTLTVSLRNFCVCGNGITLILFLHTDYTVTRKWKNINLPALESRKHVCTEDWRFGVLKCRQKRDHLMNPLILWEDYYFFNIEISSFGSTMFSLCIGKTYWKEICYCWSVSVLVHSLSVKVKYVGF